MGRDGQCHQHRGPQGPSSPLLLGVALEALADAMRQGEEIEGMRLGENEIVICR